MQPPEPASRALVQAAVAIWKAGVAAVDGERAVIDSAPRLFGRLVKEDSFDRIFAVGAGKASAAMARGLEQLLRRHGLLKRVAGSWINVPDAMADGSSAFHLHGARPAGVNLPTARVVEGTRRIIGIVEAMTGRDLCFCLVSGGGSALLAAPVPPVTLEEKRDLAQKLSALGADITQLNTVRKNISQVKGGRLARRCGGGQLVSLIVSDIMGDPVELIASGPTAASPDGRAEALAVLERFDPGRRLFAPSIYTVLEWPEEKPFASAHVTNLVVANNPIAVEAARREAETRGFECRAEVDTDMHSDASAVARQLSDWIVRASADGGPNALVSGGEPVVRLCGDPGRGGRNQQVVIEAIERLASRMDFEPGANRIAVLSAGTDGEDGTTQAAGAWLDAGILRWARANPDVLRDHRKRNDACSLFERLGNLLVTGPTGTNVCDLRVALVA